MAGRAKTEYLVQYESKGVLVRCKTCDETLGFMDTKTTLPPIHEVIEAHSVEVHGEEP